MWRRFTIEAMTRINNFEAFCRDKMRMNGIRVFPDVNCAALQQRHSTEAKK